MDLARENHHAMNYIIIDVVLLNSIASINSVWLLGISIIQDHWFCEFNRERRMLTDKIKDGCLKSVVSPQNIDAVRERKISILHIKR